MTIHDYKQFPQETKVNTLEEEQLKQIEEYVNKIVTPIFMKSIYEKQRRDNKNLEEWFK